MATVSGVREILLSTLGTQVTAIVVILLAIVVGTQTLARIASAARTRYGPKPAEAIRTTELIGAIVLSIPVLAFVWEVSHVLDYFVNILALDR